MGNEENKGIERERIAGALIAFISASFIMEQLIFYSYINITWEINLVIAILLLIVGFIGFGNPHVGGILLIIIGILLLVFQLVFFLTSFTIFFQYSPWDFLRDNGVSFEGILNVIGGILFLHSSRKC